jgi:hypothetical protein
MGAGGTTSLNSKFHKINDPQDFDFEGVKKWMMDLTSH